MDTTELLNQAINELQFLKSGEEFELKDLFKGYEWRRISQGVKSTLGTLFLSYASSDIRIKILKRDTTVKKYMIIVKTSEE